MGCFKSISVLFLVANLTLSTSASPTADTPYRFAATTGANSPWNGDQVGQGSGTDICLWQNTGCTGQKICLTNVTYATYYKSPSTDGGRFESVWFGRDLLQGHEQLDVSTNSDRPPPGQCKTVPDADCNTWVQTVKSGQGTSFPFYTGHGQCVTLNATSLCMRLLHY